MNIRTPEYGGIHSSDIKAWIEGLEAAQLSTHDIIIARGNDILFEHYRTPFTPDFLHRMYSVTKSFVSMAVGFAKQDGLVALDDPIAKYFPEEAKLVKDPNTAAQTVRQMLKMSTPKRMPSWFTARHPDRVRHYFETAVTAAPCGSEFWYDSTGSFVLGAMVEKVTGKSLVDYLREKLFNKIGISREAHFLECPGGYAWGDSALLAKPRDLLLAARFILNGGSWNGEQLLDADYVKEATSNLIPTEKAEGKGVAGQGYGYLIWQTYDNSFYFNGMGCQFAVSIPEKDIILIYNGDNQGINGAGETVIGSFFEKVARKATALDGNGKAVALPESEDRISLQSYVSSLVLAYERGMYENVTAAKIDGRVYTLNGNPMGITKLCFRFDGDMPRMLYTNVQGDKVLPFGMGKNVFGFFPEEGYSRKVGSQYCADNYYYSATSAAWKNENILTVNVQIIDEYFGRLWMDFVFDGEEIHVKMRKTAEDFLDTYTGEAVGHV